LRKANKQPKKDLRLL